MSGKRCETTVWWSENVLPPWKLLQWPRCPGIHRSAPNAGLHSTGGRRCQGPRRDLDQETRQSWKFNLQKVKLEKFSDCCANWLMWSELNWIELVWCIGVDNSTGSNSRTDAKTGLRRKHLFLPICGTIHCIPPAAFSGRLACEKQHTHTHTAFTIVRHTFGGNKKDYQSILKQVEGSAILHQNCIIIGKMRRI